MFFRHFVRTAALFICALMLSGAANAQSILVVDQAKVLRDSNVGKHVQNQLQSIGAQMDAEVKSAGGSIKSEYDSLKATTQSMTPEQRRARPDLEQRALELQKKMQNAQAEMSYKQRELVATEQKALGKVNEKLAKILETIVAERGAQLVVDRSMVIYGAPAIDITDDVISRLNSEMRTVSVTRERLPRR